MCCGKFWRQWIDAAVPITDESSPRKCDFSLELLHLSEVSGWCHISVARRRSDVEERRTRRWEVASVTHGSGWLVHRVLRVQGRRVWFLAGGSGLVGEASCGSQVLEGGCVVDDPYHAHLCVVDIDQALALQAAPWRAANDFARAAMNLQNPGLSPGVVVLTAISGGGSLVSGTHRASLSPGGSVFVDVSSRVDHGPVTSLRCASTGVVLADLEAANLEPLKAKGWVKPERFCAPGRDGSTAIYGILLHPPKRDLQTSLEPSCPVLENVYAGPHGAHSPVEFSLLSSLQSFARQGFVVAMCDGMGTNKRGRAFLERCWKDLADSGLPDRRAFLEAAAAQRPWMDLGHRQGGRRIGVGIIGGSAGGQTAVRALLDHGDFYGVAVADCGCHDNRVDKVWWNEAFMGPPLGSLRRAGPPRHLTYATGYLPSGGDLACSGAMSLARAKEECLRAAEEVHRDGGEPVVGITWFGDKEPAEDATVEVWVKSAACGQRLPSAAAGWHTLLLGYVDDDDDDGKDGNGDAYERSSNVAGASRLRDDAKLMLIVGERFVWGDNCWSVRSPASARWRVLCFERSCRFFQG